MAIIPLGNNVYYGLSTDTKPTNVPINAKFRETNTGRELLYNGTSWIAFNKTRETHSGFVYKDDDNYYISTDKNGDITNRNNTDASIAANAIVNNIFGGTALGYGGKIKIGAGDFQCKTLIDVSIDTTGYYNVALEGNEFLSTRLNFTPDSALTNGIRLKMLGAGLRDLRIYGNNNVTNLVNVEGKGTGFKRTDYGRIRDVYFAGHSATDEANARTITAGQKGVYMNGSAATLATYFWDISHCVFDGLDNGMHLYNQHSTSTNQMNNDYYYCNEAIKLSGGQHSIVNVWHQGTPSIGRYTVHALAEGTGQANQLNLVNINAELHVTGQKCAAVFIENPLANIRMFAIRNAYSDPDYHFSVIDESRSYGNFDIERMIIPRPSKTNKRVGFWTGAHAQGGGDGIVNGRTTDITSGSASQASVNAASGVNRSFSTGSTINSTSGRLYNGNFIIRAANPEWFTKVFFNSITDVRVFIGFIDVYGNTVTTSADPLNTPRTGAGLWIDTNVSNVIKVMSNDGTGASTVTNLTGSPVIENTAIHDIKITAKDSLNKFTITYDNVETHITSDIPVSADDLGFMHCIENLAASNKSLFVYYAEVTMDR